MEKQQSPVRIELTDEQKEQIKQASGKIFSALEFNAEELEQRVAPSEAVSFNFTKVEWKY